MVFLMGLAMDAGAVSIDRLSGDLEPGMPVRIVASSSSVSVIDPSTGTTGNYGQVAVSSTAVTQILPADTTRMGNPTICNETNVILYVGYSVSVSATNARSLDEGQCWWPEGPAVYRGAIHGLATGPDCRVSYDMTTK